MKLKIIDIIRWELLRHKSFNDFAPTDEDDILTLSYVTDAAARTNLYSAYKHLYEEKQLDIEQKIKSIGNYIRYANQFAEKTEAKTDTKNPISVHEVVGDLVVSGADATYIMQLGIEYLPWLCNSVGEHAKKRAEDKRYWSMILCSPYIDRSQVHNAHEFLPFDWDKEGGATKREVSDTDLKIAKFLFGKNKK